MLIGKFGDEIKVNNILKKEFIPLDSILERR